MNQVEQVAGNVYNLNTCLTIIRSMEHRRRTLFVSIDDDIPSSPDLHESPTVSGNAIKDHNQYVYKGTISEIWMLMNGIVNLIYWKFRQYIL